MISFNEYKKVIKEFEESYKEYDIIKFALLHKVIKNILRYKLYSENNKDFDEDEYRKKYEGNVIEAHKKYIKGKSNNFVKISEDFTRDNEGCPLILDLQEAYTHNRPEKKPAEIPLEEIKHIKNNIQLQTRKLYKEDGFTIDLTLKDNLVNNIKKINYESLTNHMLSGTYNFATPKIQRLISWDEQRTESFLNSFIRGIPKMDIKVYQTKEEINIFDGQHRVLIFIFLWYFSTGKIIKYKVNGKVVRYWNNSFNFKTNGIKIIFDTVKKWYISNSAKVSKSKIEKIKWEISLFRKEDFARAFLLYNSNSYFREKKEGTDFLLDSLLRYYKLDLHQINDYYKLMGEYCGISDIYSSHENYQLKSEVDYIFRKTKDHRVFVASVLTNFAIEWDIKNGNSEFIDIIKFFKKVYLWCGIPQERVDEMIRYLRWLNFESFRFHKIADIADSIEKLKKGDLNLVKIYLKDDIKSTEKYKRQYNPLAETIDSNHVNPFIFSMEVEDERKRPFYNNIYLYWIKYYAFINNKEKWFSSNGKVLIDKDVKIIIPIGLRNIDIGKSRVSINSSIPIEEKYFKNVPEVVDHIFKEDIFYLDEKYYSLINKEMSAKELCDVLGNYYYELKQKVKEYAKS